MFIAYLCLLDEYRMHYRKFSVSLFLKIALVVAVYNHKDRLLYLRRCNIKTEGIAAVRANTGRKASDKGQRLLPVFVQAASN